MDESITNRKKINKLYIQNCSHLNGSSSSSSYFSEMTTYWNVSDSELVKERGLATVTINNAKFPYKTHFHTLTFILHGLISFNYCSFTGDVNIDILGSLYEPPPPSLETLSSFLSYVAQKPIKIFKSQFRLYGHLLIDVNQSGRELQISHCDIGFNFEIKSQLTEKDALILFSVQIEHGKMTGSYIKVFPLSFIHIQMMNLDMSDVKFTNLDMGKLSLHVENCNWVNSDSFMDLSQVISVNIISSQLTTNCPACSLMNVHGMKYWDNKDWFDYYSIRYLFAHSPSSTLAMISSNFILETSLNHIDTEIVDIILINSTFIITGSLSFYLNKDFAAKNVLIECFTSQMAHRTKGKSSIIYGCNAKCEGKSEYSLERGTLNISEELDYFNDALKFSFFVEPKLIPNNPTCLPCPLGANCEGTIQTLPNYWGYVTTGFNVSLARCPDGYCCQGNETCEGINSCNTGRTGTLCGTCKQNLTEALFTPKCVLAESCRSGIVITLFISAALVYTLVLLTFDTIKHKLTYLFKKGYKICKGKIHKDKGIGKCIPGKKPVEDDEKEQSGLKYIQILLYFVQDSKLFTIYLPEMNTKTDNIVVKFLEFSPEILSAYIHVTEVCFVFSSAILNVSLQLLFGFLVMLFLFLVYTIQSLVSFCVQRKVTCTDLKVKLVQAFLLTVLFSYQKMVMGAFTLVQCMNIRNQTMLFIQADMPCYTWWQIGILIHICISVVPIFFVLAHLPFYVQDKKMSVKIFIIACLFPLPVVILYHLNRLLKRKCVAKNASDKSGIETHKMVEVPCEDKIRECADEIQETEASPKGSELANIEKEETRMAVRQVLVETCEGVIVESLLKHYKCLRVFRIRFTWLGVHKIYRVALVACRTFITEPVTRLYVMTTLVMTMTLLNATIKPYKENKANTTATISYIANLYIAVLSLLKASYMAFGCDTNCQYRDTVVGYMGRAEDVLLLYVPIVALGLWFVQTGFQKCLGKCKRSK